MTEQEACIGPEEDAIHGIDPLEEFINASVILLGWVIILDLYKMEGNRVWHVESVGQ